jgi:hypothetical protein
MSIMGRPDFGDILKIGKFFKELRVSPHNTGVRIPA